MTYRTPGSDLSVCYACDRLLAAHEEVYCGPCAQRVLDTWDEPSDIDHARRDAHIARGWAALLEIITSSTIIAGLILAVGISLVRDAQAHHAPLSRVVDGRTLTWPAIGADQYTRSCEVIRAWEDRSAEAWCSEDGELYAYDPETDAWYAVSTTR